MAVIRNRPAGLGCQCRGGPLCPPNRGADVSLLQLPSTPWAPAELLWTGAYGWSTLRRTFCGRGVFAGEEYRMRAVVQRVSRADVRVGGESVGAIGLGLLVLLGVEKQDDQSDAAYLVKKTAGLRIFQDAAGKMNASVVDAGGAVLVVSQFTLFGDCRKGRRPRRLRRRPTLCIRRTWRDCGRRACGSRPAYSRP